MQRNKESKDEDNDYLGVDLDKLIDVAERSIYNGVIRGMKICKDDSPRGIPFLAFETASAKR